MLQEFDPGDYLIFQVESGYGLLRVLAVEGPREDPVWHLAAYSDLFLDVETADAAIDNAALTVGRPHLALTNRAFESTQVSKMQNSPLREDELSAYREWQDGPSREVSDRSVRLMLGLR
jgi:hypothetical protein